MQTISAPTEKGRVTMANHDCVIGLVCRYESYELATLEDLKRHIAETAEFNTSLKNDGLEHAVWLYHKEWSLKDYCDKRRSTDLTRFDYCPYCGKKIEWKKIKEESK